MLTSSSGAEKRSVLKEQHLMGQRGCADVVEETIAHPEIQSCIVAKIASDISERVETDGPGGNILKPPT